MAHKWEYGGAYQRHPIENKRVIFENGSVVQHHDIFNDLPNFMRHADTLFIDPPWNQGNISSFYTKANNNKFPNYKNFVQRLFELITEIYPTHCFIEVGKQFLPDFIMKIRESYKYVSFYNSTYYHKQTNKCYVIHATNTFKMRRYKSLEDMDEEDIISWICKNHKYKCIGDLCMGRGLVGLSAYANNKKFVGTELNHKRLSVLVEKLKIKYVTEKI